MVKYFTSLLLSPSQTALLFSDQTALHSLTCLILFNLYWCSHNFTDIANNDLIIKKYMNPGISLAVKRTLYFQCMRHGFDNGIPLQYSCLGNPMDRGAS